MRQPHPPPFLPHRRFGGPRASYRGRPALGSSPLQGCLWLPRSASGLAEFPSAARHSCLSPPLFAEHSPPIFFPHFVGDARIAAPVFNDADASSSSKQ